MATDWEAGVNFPRLIQERFNKAQASVEGNGLGAVLCFNFDNIRYITGTHIGEWCRDKMNRYAICPREGGSFLFDPAVPAKRISSPWMEERMEIPISTMLGALPPAMNVEVDFAKQIKRILTDYGVEKDPLGVDMMELPMLRALEKEGIEVIDGQQAMLDAREVKTADEIELLKQAAGMVDAVYEDIARAIRPGVREHELVALANQKLFLLGAERVECVNSVSGARGKPHSHTFSDRIIQPGDMVFLDLMHASTDIGLATTGPSSAASLTSTRSRPMRHVPSGFPMASMPSSQVRPLRTLWQSGQGLKSSAIVTKTRPSYYSTATA